MKPIIYKKTEAVVFDLGGVLFTNGKELAVPKIAEKLKKPHIIINNLLSENQEPAKSFRLGLLTSKEFWNKVLGILHINSPWQELNNLWLSSYILQSNVFEIIKKLKEKNYKLGIISNTTADRIDYLQEKYNFLIYFDAFVFSYQDRVLKPDPLAFRLVAQKIRILEFEQIVYVDDKIKNCIAASNLGFKTIHFKSSERLKSELAGFGVYI